MSENVKGQQGTDNNSRDEQTRNGQTGATEQQNTSSGGGLTDMDAGERSRAQSGAGTGMGNTSVSTKRNVTGSDFDGQVSSE